MLNVPSHLLQPLSIDTNITYDLDMSKFPGLDDPQQMHQPALLIATDWSDYVYHDAECVTDVSEMSDSSYDSDDLSVDDLYFLIESSQEFFTDFTEDHAFQSLFDDVVGEDGVATTTDTDPGTPNITTYPLEDSYNCKDDEVCFYSEGTGKQTRVEVPPKEQLPPFVSHARGQKRCRNDEIENESVKKSKMADRSSLYIPSMVSFCLRSNGFEHERQL